MYPLMNEYDQSISIVLKQHSNSIDIVCLLFKESSRKLGSITELAACKDASEMVKEKCFNFEITSVIAKRCLILKITLPDWLTESPAATKLSSNLVIIIS